MLCSTCSFDCNAIMKKLQGWAAGTRVPRPTYKEVGAPDRRADGSIFHKQPLRALLRQLHRQTGGGTQNSQKRRVAIFPWQQTAFLSPSLPELGCSPPALVVSPK